MSIDCSYGGDGLRVYIGDGRDGITCAGTSPGGSTGGGSASGTQGSSTGGSPNADLCVNRPPFSPDDIIYDKIQSSTRDWSPTVFGYRGTVAHTTYWRGSGKDAVIVATRDIEAAEGMFHIKLTDYTFYSRATGGYVVTSDFLCSQPEWSVNITAAPASQPLALPGGPVSDVPRALITTTTLRPVPFQPGQFFLRVDLDNTSAKPLPAFVDLQLSNFAEIGTLAFPLDTECLETAGMGESCSLSDIPPHTARTLLFHVTSRPGAADPSVTVMTTWIAREKFAGSFKPSTQTALEIIRPPSA